MLLTIGLLTIWSYFYYYSFPNLSELIMKERVSLKEVCTRGNCVLYRSHVIIADYVADCVIRDTRRFKKEIGVDDNQKGVIPFCRCGRGAFLSGRIRSDDQTPRIPLKKMNTKMMISSCALVCLMSMAIQVSILISSMAFSTIALVAHTSTTIPFPPLKYSTMPCLRL